jgi:putative phosphoribosyl transferase
MGKLSEDRSLRDKTGVFKDRNDAGRFLGKMLSAYAVQDGIILAIPSGGVPVAVEIAGLISLPLDLIVVRKLQIPFEPEAGFGALGPEGEVIFNEGLLKQLRLSKEQVDEAIKKTLNVIRVRNRLFRGDRGFPDVADKPVILVDDGLASGYTMLVAVQSVRKKNAGKIIVAVPTGSARTVEMLALKVDQLICPNVRAGYPFAVAEAYRAWYDLTDDDVLYLLGLSCPFRND